MARRPRARRARGGVLEGGVIAAPGADGPSRLLAQARGELALYDRIVEVRALLHSGPSAQVVLKADALLGDVQRHLVPRPRKR